MPAVHRDTDKRSCKSVTEVKGNASVYINNLLASVKNDPNSHKRGELKASNNTSVYVENKLLVLVYSDAYPDNAGHINPYAYTGSPDVYALEGAGGGSGSATVNPASEVPSDMISGQDNLSGDDPMSPEKTPTEAPKEDAATDAKPIGEDETIEPSGPISEETEKNAKKTENLDLTEDTIIGVNADSALIRTPDGKYEKLEVGDKINGLEVTGFDSTEKNERIILKDSQGNKYYLGPLDTIPSLETATPSRPATETSGHLLLGALDENTALILPETNAQDGVFVSVGDIVNGKTVTAISPTDGIILDGEYSVPIGGNFKNMVPAPVNLNRFQESRLKSIESSIPQSGYETIQKTIADYRKNGIETYPVVNKNTGEVFLATNPVLTDTGNMKIMNPVEAETYLDNNNLKFPDKSQADSIIEQADTYYAFSSFGSDEGGGANSYNSDAGQQEIRNYYQYAASNGFDFNGNAGLTALGNKFYLNTGEIYGASLTKDPNNILQTPFKHGSDYADYSHGTVGIVSTGVYVGN